MDLAKRVENYSKAFPNFPRMIADKGWILGMWNIGNDYRNKTTYHGAYPKSYLDRIHALFPEIVTSKTMHLFSGSLEPGPYIRFDIRDDTDCDIHGNAEALSTYFAPSSFDFILADPPYTESDALKYGNPMCNRNQVVAECATILKPGGFLIWLDMVLPMYRKTEWKRIGEIGITRSTNHRVRAAFIFQRI